LPNEAALEPERVAGVFTDPAPNPSKIRLRPSAAARAEDAAVPGVFVPEDKPTALEEEELDRESGESFRRAPVSAGTIPSGAPLKAQPLSSTPVQAQRDHLTNPDQVYNSEETRHRRLAAFENHLRRNRVDITAACRSCGTKEEKVA
jgi:hypothetical protein